MQISCFPAENLFLAPHLRPFASICGQNRPFQALQSPPNAQNGPQMNANSRKWACRTLSCPIFAVIPPLSVLLRPRTTPSVPLRAIFAPETPSLREFSGLNGLREAHFTRSALRSAQNRHKADLARILGLPSRALFPATAAHCAIDLPPIFRYSLATEKKSPRHVKPTSGRLNKTVQRPEISKITVK